MRIIHINMAREFRGGERQTIALIEALSRIGADDAFSQGLVVRRASPLHERCADLSGCDLLPARPSTLGTVLAARRADLVHVHEGRSAKAGALLALMGRRYVLTRRVPNRPRDLFLTRWVYARPDAICCVSDHVAEVMRDYARGPLIETVRDCVRPLERSASARPAKTPGKFVVATIGELDFAHKGQDLLAQAAGQLQARGIAVEYLVIGTGRDQQRLEAMTRDIANFRLLGWRDDVAALMRQADVLVHPARKEGLGSIILEAMSVGLPAIATRVGGVPEIVTHEHDGLLVAAESSHQIANAIARLSEDAGLREKLARNASATALSFSPETMAAEYLRIYRQLDRNRRA